MSSERNIDPFAVMILVLSVIAIILLAALPFAGFYYSGYGNRFSCFDCEYSTAGDLAAQVVILLLLIAQIIIVFNDLLPNKFIDKDLDKFGLILAALTIVWVIIGLASWGVVREAYEWWPETGFYGSIIAGILNTVLFFLKSRNK